MSIPKAHRFIACFIFLVAVPLWALSQNVYKTPSGKKYHLESCRMVVNVSSQLLSITDIATYRLEPCKICKPPVRGSVSTNSLYSSKAAGEAATVRCKGFTQKGLQCKRMTRIANGFCFQHTSQNGSPNITRSTYQPSSSTSTCGARTQAGGACKRKVKGGGRCYQHR